MKIVKSTDSNHLLDYLIKDFESFKTQNHPFEPYRIVVPSPSIQKVIDQRFVEQTGISSGVDYLNLHRFLHTIHVSLGSKKEVYLEKAQITAVLFQVFQKIKSGEYDFDTLTTIAEWLEQCSEDISVAQLAHDLADVFEVYQIYRCDYLDAWLQGELKTESKIEVWQSELWRLICDFVEPNVIFHKQQSIELLKDNIESPTLTHQLKKFSKLMIFGSNEIDEKTLSQLSIIGQKIEITYLTLEPSLEIFGSQDTSENKKTAESLKPYFADNELLAAWGKQKREQHILLESLNAKHNNLDGLDQNANHNTSTLQQVKQGIKNNQNVEQYEVIDGDDSLKLVSHFSQYREVEGLVDYLLQQFNQDQTLKPHDVVVYCSNIEAYAPYIKSVFENQAADKQLPYQISGLTQSVNDVADLMLKLLELPKTRYEINDLIALLNHSLIKRKLNLSHADIECIKHWLVAANVNWGLDDNTLEQLDLPTYNRNTLQSGLDRLILGLSFNGKSVSLNRKLIHGVEAISALDASLLSRLLFFFNQIAAIRDLAQNDRAQSQQLAIYDWTDQLRLITDNLIEVPKQESESLSAWYQLLFNIEKDHQMFHKHYYSYDYLLSTIQLKIKDSSSMSGSYRFGKINIGSMGSLKGIPAKVVAILGLNETDFPRKPEISSINLMSELPRFGDRNRTEQDKDAFLMALLNCGSKFYMSFVGKNIRSNTDRIPSLVVQELMDVLFKTEKSQKNFINQHPMNLYSNQYNGLDKKLFTFQDYEVSHQDTLVGHGKDGTDEFEPWAIPEQINIADLQKFLEDPAKQFFKERFNIYFPEIEDDLQNTEPFNLSGLNKWMLTDELITLGLEHGGINDEVLSEVALKYKSQGGMPHDKLFDEELESQVNTAQKIIDNIGLVLNDAKSTIMPVELNLNVDEKSIKLVGDIQLYATGDSQALVQISQKKGKETKDKYLLRTVLNSLVLNKVSDDKLSGASYLACSDNTYQLNTTKYQNHLADWVDLYQKVMSEPIAVNPSLAQKIAEQKTKGFKGNCNELFNQVLLQDSENQYSNLDVSVALKVLLKDQASIARTETAVDYFVLDKPGTPPENDETPVWSIVGEQR